VDSLESMLSMLLNGAVETLDISPHLQDAAVERYEEVGTWLADRGIEWRIHAQGSFMLGTVVRPATPTGEYDIDLVCLIPILKESLTQAELKQRVGDQLQAYRRWKITAGHDDGPASCESRRRCWTLGYPDLGFHLDVLPSIPDTELPPTGILLTDKQLRSWQHSNPIGYGEWFRQRSAELQTKLREAAFDKNVNVADVPTWRVRSTLQRVVQILKWHATVFFTDDPDGKPPSILITTLAARAYRGETDLFAATRHIVATMQDHVEKRSGRYWVPNPAHPDENFADKWNEYPDRREAYLKWHAEITTVLHDLAQLSGTGLDVVVSRLEKSFPSNAVRESATRYGEHMRRQRIDGLLRVAPTGQITTTTNGPRLRNHTFHGDVARPRA
jgi:hypothetical protein